MAYLIFEDVDPIHHKVNLNSFYRNKHILGSNELARFRSQKKAMMDTKSKIDKKDPEVKNLQNGLTHFATGKFKKFKE